MIQFLPFLNLFYIFRTNWIIKYLNIKNFFTKQVRIANSVYNYRTISNWFKNKKSFGQVVLLIDNKNKRTKSRMFFLSRCSKNLRQTKLSKKKLFLDHIISSTQMCIFMCVEIKIYLMTTWIFWRLAKQKILFLQTYILSMSA